MKEYSFRLQKVLKTKKIKQDLEQKKLVEKEQRLAEEKLQLQELQDKERKFLEEFKQQRLNVNKGHVFQKYTSYQRQVEKYIDQQNSKIDEVSEAVKNQRFELIKAAKETKTLDKLKEKDYTEYLYEQNMTEQKRVDELSLLKPHKEKSGFHNG